MGTNSRERINKLETNLLVAHENLQEAQRKMDDAEEIGQEELDEASDSYETASQNYQDAEGEYCEQIDRQDCTCPHPFYMDNPDSDIEGPECWYCGKPEKQPDSAKAQ